MRPAGLLVLFLFCAHLAAEVKRVVIIKLDGVPENFLESELARIDPLTHKSTLPWISHIFDQRGTRLDNFYVRAISLSTPSWSLLDTGQHLQIHGNAEFDRYTDHVYDYMNFFPFYVNYARSHRVDMPGVEVLDSLGIPLLIDYFPYAASYQSFQLYQRGVRWKTLQNALPSRFSRSLRELLDEWTIGFEIGSSVEDQTERELIAKLHEPQHPIPRLLHRRFRSRRPFGFRRRLAAPGPPTHRRSYRPHLDRHRIQSACCPNRPDRGLRSRHEHATRRLQPGLQSAPVFQ